MSNPTTPPANGAEELREKVTRYVTALASAPEARVDAILQLLQAATAEAVQQAKANVYFEAMDLVRDNVEAYSTLYLRRKEALDLMQQLQKGSE